MEVKINREIRDYQESIFFGLNLRQLIFSILAILVAVGIYFGFQNLLGTETVSWLCILGAFPFGAMGFIKYNGMTAEQMLRVMRPHPTFDEGVGEALEDLAEKLRRG